MLRGRRETADDPLRAAFDATVEIVERAKAALVAVVPAGRAPGRPLSDALISFEDGLRAARESLSAWPSSAREIVGRCAEAIDESLRRAEKLRLDAPQLDYESLVMTLGILLEPLEAFEEADRVV